MSIVAVIGLGAVWLLTDLLLVLGSIAMIVAVLVPDRVVSLTGWRKAICDPRLAVLALVTGAGLQLVLFVGLVT